MAFFGGPSAPVSRLEELKRLLQKDPTSRQFLALAEEYRRHGKYRDAVITLERGLQIHATSVAAHVALGRTYQQLDRLEDATRAFTNALRIDRENLVAIRQLAEVYLSKGDKVEAIKKLKLYRGLNSGDRDVNEIIQRLEEEMSAAGAERLRSGVFPAVSPAPEAPRSPYPAGPNRRAAMIPRLDRAPAEPPPAPAPPPEAEREVLELTYDGPKRAKPAEGVAPAPKAPSLAPEVPPPPSVLAEAPPPVASVPQEPARGFEPPPPAADLESIHEAPAPEIPSLVPERVAFDDVPIEEATAPLEFPVDLYETRVAGAAVPPPFEAPPFEIPDEPPPSQAAPEPLVSETLADLYRAQGHVADARETYRALAETTPDEARAEALLEKAASLPPALRTDHPRLRRLARRFPKRPDATVDELQGLVQDLVDRTEGIRAATLADVAGLPVVMAGASARDAATETLVAELSSFLKNVRRTAAETGAGDLESLAIAGPLGAAFVSRVHAGYSLILQVDPDAALGEIRWEAARTARALVPAVR